MAQGRPVEPHLRQRIERLSREGWSKSQIARTTGVDRAAVRRIAESTSERREEEKKR